MIEIPLTQNQVAIIDDEDFELVSRYRWYAAWSPLTKSFYARAKTRKPDGRHAIIQMHRIIKGAQKGQQVDHIHHNTLDNRKSELRLCTGSQNQHNKGIQANNTSGYKGVCWNKSHQKWTARIRLNGKQKNLGYYATPEAANSDCITARTTLHGDFARDV
jgi:hypothetical protein